MTILRRNFSIDYSITSQLGLIYDARYFQEISANIYDTTNVDEEDETPILAGTILGYKLFFDHAIENGYPIREIFELTQETEEIGNLIFKKNSNEFKNDIEKFFNYNLSNINLLMVSRIEINENYRGMALGLHVIKDFIMNFDGGVSLVVGKAFPLQHEGNVGKSFKQDTEKLIDHYGKLGYRNIPKISKEYIFLNREMNNVNFNSFDLDLQY